MANLASSPKFQAFDLNGDPLSGGKLYTYLSGTSTPATTYTDAGGGTPNANPVILDSRGEADVWLPVDVAYRYTLKTAADVLIWTVDGIYGSLTTGGLQNNTTNWVVAGGTADAITATYVPAISSLADGQLCFFRATGQNTTTTPSFSPNGLPARTITMKGGAAVHVGALPGALAEVILRYNLANTRWELVNPAAAAAIEPVRLPVRVATTGLVNVGPSAPLVVDGVTLVAGNRVLVRVQDGGNPHASHGIYTVTTPGTGSNGTWTRATDADSAGDLFGGMLVSVSEGTANADSLWMLTTDDPITIGTTALTFEKPYAGKGANADITSMTAVTAINRTGGTAITGTNTNDNAAAGVVGEYIESVVSVGSPVALTTNVQANITSISLTAGDWDVSGQVGFVTAGTTSVTRFDASVSTTSATIDATSYAKITTDARVPGAVTAYILTPNTRRVSLASTTTVYLVANSTFTVAANSGYGVISARRVR